jgi:multicomponent Na+:H+ antiporter subunit E
MKAKKISVLSTLLSFISLMAFWLLMSGYFDLIHIAYGVVSVIGVMMVNRSLATYAFFEDDHNESFRIRPIRALLYLFWILGQILIAGWRVAVLILRPSLPAKPAMVTFRADLPTARAKMILGNSITLTPGTLTVDIEGDQFTVHSVDSFSYEGIINDDMPKRVLKLFSTEDRPVVYDVVIQDVVKHNEMNRNEGQDRLDHQANVEGDEDRSTGGA